MDRIIVHLDVDCFYAQAEMLQRPWLHDRPVGVTQKFLVVTCNYVARKLGVPKMASIDEAKKCCSDIVLINGEDLTPYRYASKSIMEVVKRYGTLERKGLDECAVDITEEVNRRKSPHTDESLFIGVVVGCEGEPENNSLLALGTRIAAEMRCAVEQETGFQCSAGIAHNKMLAKLACSLNKPNNQTCILLSAVEKFLLPLPVRKIPGVGTQTEVSLKELGVTTLGDLQRIPLSVLVCKFGERIGTLLYENCRGYDKAPVKDKGHLKSISVEDSFKPCSSLTQAKEIMTRLAPDLIARLDEDREESGRRPRTLTVKWRSRGSWNFTSTSTQMAMELLSNAVTLERRIEVLVEAGMRLLMHSLQGREFCVLNIGATNFVDTSSDVAASADIRTLLRTKPVKGGTEVQSAKVTAPVPASTRKSAEGNDFCVDNISAKVSLAEAEKGAQYFLQHEVETQICGKCGRAVDVEDLQEHMDFHVASELQLMENRFQDVQTRAKRCKRNKTLDSFFEKQ